MRRTLIAALVVLPAPLHAAAESRSAEALDRLAAACDAAATDPASLAVPGPDAQGGRTADGSIAMRSEALPGLAGDGDGVATLTTSAYRLPAGLSVGCVMTIFRPAPDDFADLLQVAADRTPALLGGDAVTVGGQLLSLSGESAQGKLWTTPDFPPSASLHLLVSGQLITMSFARNLPSK